VDPAAKPRLAQLTMGATFLIAEVQTVNRAERLAVSNRGRVDVLVRRCALLGLACSGVHRKPMATDAEE
jgi:hypothetical protein